jgi:uncharacterized protein (UPF0332 family)
VKEETKRFLEKAARAIKAAERLFGDADIEFATGRAYYAMFYTAEALLIEDGLSFRKHAGVHASFGERFAKAGRFDPKYHRWLLNAFDKRIEGDYGVESNLASEDASSMIDQAREFLDQARRFLESAP